MHDNIETSTDRNLWLGFPKNYFTESMQIISLKLDLNELPLIQSES